MNMTKKTKSLYNPSSSVLIRLDCAECDERGEKTEEEEEEKKDP